MTSLLQTPLSAWHQAHGAKMAPFAGWNMPIQYPTGIIAEHLHTREKAGLFDICHMGEIIVDGKGAADALSQAVTVNISTLKPGRCRYGFLLNDRGGIMDDLIVYRMREDRFMVVVNAGCRASDLAALKERVGAAAIIEDVSDATAKVDLQGPESFAVLESLVPGPWRRLPYFGFTEDGSFDGEAMLVSRTGYTGELGVEIYCPAAKIEALWELLLTDERVKPVGLGARDTLRLEVGLPLYGQDLDEDHSPAEAGYAAMLTSQAAYVGQDKARDVREKLVALMMPGRRSARHGDVVLLDGKEVGLVTSGSFGPSVGNAIALAYVKAEAAGAAVYGIRAAKTELRAEAVALPFYAKGTARNTLV
ncbi:glycine cleavage system aminomethyltransferase GcvT [Desulfovibrio sp. OttesenSCG-928-M14]|nr:glycine cleavage system aminomethyltransferase GcvT [Desulfovibrio sp. OttesenSCG-928-M14]